MPGFTYKSYSFVDKRPDDRRAAHNRSAAWLDLQGYPRAQRRLGRHAQQLVHRPAPRSPQAATINAVARSMGWKLGLVPYDTKSLVQPTPAPPKPPQVPPKPREIKRCPARCADEQIQAGGSADGQISSRAHNQPGETLFDRPLARVLPIEDLSVEEIAPTPVKSPVRGAAAPPSSSSARRSRSP